MGVSPTVVVATVLSGFDGSLFWVFAVKVGGRICVVAGSIMVVVLCSGVFGLLLLF
jgi:hypothetical protein